METEWLSKKVRACEGWGWVGGKWSLWATFSVLSWVAQTITSLEDLSSQIHKKCFFRGFSSSAFDTFSCIVVVVVVVVVVHVSTCVVTEASFTFASRPRFAVVVDVTVVVVAAVLGVICVILAQIFSPTPKVVGKMKKELPRKLSKFNPRMEFCKILRWES